MSLTNTVSSLAHDVANTASELGSEIGSQASDLAHALARKVPGIKPQRHVPWGWIIAGAVVALIIAARMKKKSADT